MKLVRVKRATRPRKAGFVASRAPISYDRFARTVVRPSDRRSIFVESGWHSTFRQTHIQNIVDPRWCRRARVRFRIVLHLQPWPLRLRERTHPFYPQPKRHKGVWGRGRLRADTLRGIRRRPDETRRKPEHLKR